MKTMDNVFVKVGGGCLVKLGTGMYLNSYFEAGCKETAKIYATKDHAKTAFEIWLR